MSMSVGSMPNTTNVKATPPATRAPDGDYLNPGGLAATVKDLDNDYKALATPAHTSSVSVQTAVTGLNPGGGKA